MADGAAAEPAGSAGSVEGADMRAALPEDVLLDVRGLRTHFHTRAGVVKAVDDVSFALRRGRTTCVVGESGSGKSITARSILQIVDAPGRIEGGRIRLRTGPRAGGREGVVDLTAMHPRGRAIRDIRGRDVAMIFQEPMSSLSPVHTIGDQIVETIRLHEPVSKREARARAIELLRRVEIRDPEGAVDQYTFEFSGGMRQRAMIAMALSCNPQVLIADEPTTALDVTTQAEILDLVRELQDGSGMSVMFITHDMGVVAEIADDVVVMRHGKVVETGPVADVFAAPRHPYTRALLESVVKLEARAAIKPPEAEVLARPRRSGPAGGGRERRLRRRQADLPRGHRRASRRRPRQLRRHARRGARHRRRERVGQDDAGARHRLRAPAGTRGGCAISAARARSTRPR